MKIKSALFALAAMMTFGAGHANGDAMHCHELCSTGCNASFSDPVLIFTCYYHCMHACIEGPPREDDGLN